MDSMVAERSQATAWWCCRGRFLYIFTSKKMSARRKEEEEEGGGGDGRRKRRRRKEGTGKDNHDGPIRMSVSLSTVATSHIKTTHCMYVFF